MKLRRLLSVTLVGTATLGLLLPPQCLQAADNPGLTKAAEASKAPTTLDVALSPEGALTGVIVDEQGRPLKDSEVVLSQSRNSILKAKTDTKGRFEFKNMKSGLYQLSSGKHGGLVRVWSEKTAPKMAKKQALLVAGDAKLVRAQGEFMDFTGMGMVAAVGLGIAGVTLGAIALSKANDAEDQTAATQAQNAALQAQIAAQNREIESLQRSLNEL